MIPKADTISAMASEPFGYRTRWLVCALPPILFIWLEETPGLSGLDGINAAGLIVLSPVLLVGGFGLTAAIALVTRWIGRIIRIQSRFAHAFLMLVIVGLLSPLAYLDGDWVQLAVVEIASLPAALFLTRSKSPEPSSR